MNRIYAKTAAAISAGLACIATADAQTAKTTLTVPSDADLKVYRTFIVDEENGTPLEPASVRERKGVTEYTYMLEPGTYHFISSGDGYYRFMKNFNAGDRARTINADPGRKAGNGYEAGYVHGFTDECAANFDTKALRRKFPKVLTTPAFSKGKARQEYTSQEEMEAFIARLDDSKDNMYVFSAGRSADGRNMPLVVMTTDNISGMSLEDAAAALRADGKPSVYLHGMIHGIEPSGTEGCLAAIAELDGKYGREWLPKVNVIIVPRVNCDGAKMWSRGTKKYEDLNRDNVLVRQPEIKATHYVYNLFLPEIVLDMHEYGLGSGYYPEEGFLDDAGITVSGNVNNTKALNDLMTEIMRHTEKRAADVGLRFWEYVQYGYSNQSPLHASHYYALRGSANFLVEVPSATGDKRAAYARRVFTQFYAAKTLIEFAADNSDRLRSIVAADRAATAAAGERFDPSDCIALSYFKNEESYNYNRKKFDLRKGSFLKDTTVSIRYFEVPGVTRPRPTAYVIPKSVAGISTILETARCNGIEYYETGRDEALALRKYEGSGKEASLLEEAVYAFDCGAYVFPMNQPSGIVLAILMEPDWRTTSRFPVSFVQAKLVGIDELYRCEKDLVAGKVPSTAITIVK